MFQKMVVIDIKKKIITTSFLLLALFSFYFYQNNIVTVSEYDYINEKIPHSFNGFKIMQISDWHNKNFGNQIIEKVEKSNPDIIILTGDIIDVYHPQEERVYEFLDELTSKYPVYFISGNHEKAVFKKNFIIKKEIKNKNLVYLENDSVDITLNGENITIYGIKDYTYNKDVWFDLEQTIDKENSNFSILLAHQPEYFEEYSKYNVDLIFSGHEHGGQIRLPFIGSIYSHQGWFSDLTAGIHELNNTTMIISRGLGNSKMLPIRLFNQPELVLTTLYNK